MLGVLYGILKGKAVLLPGFIRSFWTAAGWGPVNKWSGVRKGGFSNVDLDDRTFILLP